MKSSPPQQDAVVEVWTANFLAFRQALYHWAILQLDCRVYAPLRKGCHFLQFFLFFVTLFIFMCCDRSFNPVCRTTGAEDIHSHSILNKSYNSQKVFAIVNAREKNGQVSALAYSKFLRQAFMVKTKVSVKVPKAKAIFSFTIFSTAIKAFDQSHCIYNRWRITKCYVTK